MSQESEDKDKQDGELPAPVPISSLQGPNLPPHLRELAQKTNAAAEKTKLDYDAMGEVVNQSVAKKEEQVAELAYTQEPAPIKPYCPIDKFEKSSPCGSKTDSKEKVGFCEKCHLRFYDFAGMEMPQAEELIFKMEGLEKFRLFKRADGRFMTKDCPVGRSRKMLTAVALVCGVIIAAAVGLMSMMIPRAPEVSSEQLNPVQADSQRGSDTGNSKTDSSSNSDGSTATNSESSSESSSASNSQGKSEQGIKVISHHSYGRHK